MRLKFLVTALLIVALSIPAFSASMISRDKAVDAAKKQVPDSTLVRAEPRMEGRTLVYDVVLLDLTNKMQIVKVSATDGSIVQMRNESIDGSKALQLRQVKISHDDAVKTALKDMKDSQLIKSELDTEGGRLIYEIEFVDADGYEYEAAVDAIDGSLIYRNQEDVKRYTPKINRSQAEKAATDSMKGNVLYTTIDDDNNVVYYEVTLVSDDLKLYEIYVDAGTGKVVRTETK